MIFYALLWTSLGLCMGSIIGKVGKLDDVGAAIELHYHDLIGIDNLVSVVAASSM